MPLAHAFAVEAREAARVMQSEDAREGPRAFAEKREPAYRGR
jgi:enoyl-CoA hydratase/carnithine racemase